MLKKISSIPPKEIAPGFHARFIHTENFTLSYVTAGAGAVLPAHSHIHEQTSQIIEGEFEMTVGENTTLLKPGMVVVIPSNIVHSGKALSDCIIQDVFCPVREDYKQLS